MKIPYRELYFQSYPIGLFAYSAFAGVISLLLPIGLFYNLNRNLPLVYLVLYLFVLFFNRKMRIDVCIYYGMYRKTKVAGWLKNVPRSTETQYSNVSLMILSILSYLLLVGPIIGAFYYFFVFPFDIVAIVMALIYVTINLVPLVQIKKDFVSGYCEFPAKSN